MKKSKAITSFIRTFEEEFHTQKHDSPLWVTHDQNKCRLLVNDREKLLRVD